MQLVRRPRPLSERECYLRLYGTRTHLVEVLQARLARQPEPVPEGPTALGPAVHLAIRYPRGQGRMTGEELRVALEQRMLARPASGLPRAARWLLGNSGTAGRWPRHAAPITDQPSSAAGSASYRPLMEELEHAVDSIAAEHGFSGVVRVDREDELELAKAYGLAHRGYEIPNTVDTQFAVASGSKGLTAVTVASLIEDGLLALSTTARSLLGTDLPLIRDDVTVEHLLSHRSGIGDYLDEEVEVELDLDDYLMPVPVHELATTEQYLAVLDGHETKFPPDERFAYCNGGYVVLALIAERASGMPFHELVRRRVCEPAGMDAFRVPALR